MHQMRLTMLNELCYFHTWLGSGVVLSRSRVGAGSSLSCGLTFYIISFAMLLNSDITDDVTAS